MKFTRFVNHKTLSGSILSVIILLMTYLFFGFFYERYEVTFSVLGSGALTPGMVYNDFYYFAHIILIKLYAVFYTYLPGIEWLTVFQYLYMLTGFVLITKILMQSKQTLLLTTCAIFLMSCFFIDHYINHVCTRVSFIVSFAALLSIVYSKYLGQLTKSKSLIYFSIFIIGMLTRPEPAFLILIIVALFYFIVLDNNTFFSKIKSSLKLFSIPLIMSFTIFIWFAYDIKNADEFYKEIEPDVEYEITARNNIIPIGQMKTKRDSLRHTAVDIVLWGDATTNDADFLRSLMMYDSYDLFSETLFNFAIDSLKNSISKNLPIFYLNLFLFFYLAISLFVFKSPKRFAFVFFQLIFYLLIFIISYRVKMTETAISSMFFSVSILYVAYFVYIKNKISLSHQIVLSICFLIFSGYQLLHLNKHSNDLESNYQQFNRQRENIEQIAVGKNLFLNNESSNILLQSLKPFDYIDFSNFNLVYLYGEQHITTIEPYRSYLSSVCDCDPNHYGEFFNFVKSGGDDNVFIMSESFMEFITEYLVIVHELEINWHELPYSHIETQKLHDNKTTILKFYSPY